MERGSALEYCGENAVIGSKEDKKDQRSKKNKGQRKENKDKAKGRGGNGDRSVQSGDRNHSIEMEQAEVSAEMTENPGLEHAEGIMSRSDVKKDMKKKKKDKEAHTISQKQILDTSDESVGSEYVERNEGEGEHDSKLKKGKRKQRDGETFSNSSSGDQIVSGGDKKRKRKQRSITLEEGNEVDMSKMGRKTEGKKKRRKERDSVGVDLLPPSQNIRTFRIQNLSHENGHYRVQTIKRPHLKLGPIHDTSSHSKIFKKQ